jgi:hypothetical protein
MRAAILALAIVLPAQAAEISGRIQFSAEIALEQAQIALVNEATGVRRVALSNADGYYAIANAQPGIYKLIVRKPGFKTAVRMDIRLEVDELARVDLTMQLGAIEETIVVQADSSPLDAEDASMKTVVGRDYVENLPVAGRSLLSLLELAGGVLVTPANGTNTTTYGAGQFSVNGQRADANYITVDGVSVNGGIAAPFGPQQTASQSPGGTLPAYTAIGSMHDVVSMEALDQFRLDTATTRTEFGRMPGGQLSLNTRSGSNEFHGAMFEYFRNEKLGANDWFANRDGVARPPVKYHDFGGVLGGPLISNRTFFFLSQEAVRLGQSSAVSEPLPSATLREQLPTALRGFLVGVPIPDPALVDPGLGIAPSTDMIPQSSWVTATSLRIDHTVTSRLQIFGRYNHAPSWSSATQYFGTQATALDMSAETVTLGADAAISSTTQGSLRFGYLGTAQDMAFRPYGTAANADPGYAELMGTPPAETGYAVAAGLNYPGPTNWHSRYSQRQWNVTGSMSATAGRHQMRGGLDWRQVSPTFQAQPYLVQAFYSVAGAGILAGQQNTTLFLNGQKLEPAVIRLENVAAFVEDAWKLSGKLTLSYGLRLESNPPPLSPDGKALFGAVVPGSPATVRTGSAGGDLWKNGYRHLAPRFGWAFRPSTKRGLVWRSGAGIFYDLGFGSALQATPFVAAQRVIYQTTFPGNVPGPLTDSGWMPPQAAPQSIAQDFQTPITWRWNTTLEQSFAGRNAVSVSYVGAAGRHLLRVEDTATSHYMASRGSSGYHALQAQSSLHLADGFQAMASFVWSHSIDNASIEDYQPGPPGEISPVVPFPIDRGNSDFDVRLSSTVAALYQPKRLAGWSLDAVFRARTGFPLYWGSRPDLLGGSAVWVADTDSPTGRRLNPAAFAAAPSDRQGTLGRNVLFGPGMWQLDMALQREFRFQGRVALQLRMEAFNLLNHPNFGNPDVYVAALGTHDFGIPSTMLNQFLGSGGPANGLTPALQIGGPRALQIALRLRF